jgi:hypothetical protein
MAGCHNTIEILVKKAGFKGQNIRPLAMKLNFSV